MRALVDRRAGGGDGQAGGRRHLCGRSPVRAGAGRSLRRPRRATGPACWWPRDSASTGAACFPRARAERDAEIVALVDPIDGTRGLMYQKRPAWILTGIAPYRGGARDARGHSHRGADRDSAGEAAPRRHAVGRGRRGRPRRTDRSRSRARARRWRCGRRGRRRSPTASAASRSSSPGRARELAAIDDAVVSRLLGEARRRRRSAGVRRRVPVVRRPALRACGRPRSLDGRPAPSPSARPARRWAARRFSARTRTISSCELIAREAGVIVTDPRGAPLSAPLDVTSRRRLDRVRERSSWRVRSAAR